MALDSAAIRQRMIAPFGATFSQLLAQKDSIGLTKAQVDTLTRLNVMMLRRVDSVMAPVAARYARLQPDDITRDMALAMATSQRDAAAILYAFQVAVSELLGPDGRKKLKDRLAFTLDPVYLKAVKETFTGPVSLFFF
jgi:hypothetical protein